jgi:hypothetical protein
MLRILHINLGRYLALHNNKKKHITSTHLQPAFENRLSPNSPTNFTYPSQYLRFLCEMPKMG